MKPYVCELCEWRWQFCAGFIMVFTPSVAVNNWTMLHFICVDLVSQSIFNQNDYCRSEIFERTMLCCCCYQTQKENDLLLFRRDNDDAASGAVSFGGNRQHDFVHEPIVFTLPRRRQCRAIAHQNMQNKSYTHSCTLLKVCQGDAASQITRVTLRKLYCICRTLARNKGNINVISCFKIRLDIAPNLKYIAIFAPCCQNIAIATMNLKTETRTINAILCRIYEQCFLL